MNIPSTKANIRRARQRLANFSARESNCPLCGKSFRCGCDHSVEQAVNRLEENIVKALVQHELKKRGITESKGT